jgi:hypothetical protein|tara:strand:- start:4224 stop:4337 length:114 start_codon:yes stop_codon:yes gene_type:complete
MAVARSAFADGYSLAILVGATMLISASAVILRWFPRD